MNSYWFWGWLTRQRVSDGPSLRKALHRPGAVERLLQLAPPTIAFTRNASPDFAELTGGKGIDLTGGLGCRHIDCLSKEIDSLFRHAWHYFDRISLPDQALDETVTFQKHKDVEALCKALEPFVLVLHRLHRAGGLELVRFDPRNPPCTQHFQKHAAEAQIAQAFVNMESLTAELARDAKFSFEEQEVEGHRHISYRLDCDAFEHSEWGNLCAKSGEIPGDASRIRASIISSVLQTYLAALSADALAARRAHAPLGAAVPFYKRLLATRPPPSIEEVAFELDFPVTNNAPIESLIKLRRDESDAFSRLQFALRKAIGERLTATGSHTAAAVAKEVQRDVVDPELRNIREKLRRSRFLALRGAGAGIGLGAITATVGLLSPLGATPIGAGLAIGGAIAAVQGLKKAQDDELAAHREVQLSDLYFLWKGHTH